MKWDNSNGFFAEEEVGIENSGFVAYLRNKITILKLEKLLCPKRDSGLERFVVFDVFFMDELKAKIMTKP
ncbi:hypothetical protein BSM4216_1173 [Bacillus smithii]|nr:hypothetical protein BSM4216_1173 [Bacillus smithii]